MRVILKRQDGRRRVLDWEARVGLCALDPTAKAIRARPLAGTGRYLLDVVILPCEAWSKTLNGEHIDDVLPNVSRQEVTVREKERFSFTKPFALISKNLFLFCPSFGVTGLLCAIRSSSHQLLFLRLRLKRTVNGSVLFYRLLIR